MATQNEVTSKPLHPMAKELAKRYVDEFAVSLLLKSKIRAYSRKAEEVLSNDIEEAFNALAKERVQNWGKEFATILGGVLFGTFVPGFINSLSPANILLIVVWVIVGFGGISLIFWGLYRR